MGSHWADPHQRGVGRSPRRGGPGRQAGPFASLSVLNQEAGGDPQHVAASGFRTEVMQPWDSRAVGAEPSLTCPPQVNRAPGRAPQGDAFWN